MIRTFDIRFWLGAALFLLAACSEGATPGAPAGGDQMERAKAAVANAARLDEDWADDNMRKPADVLAFIGVEPGMTVFELEAGQGYYTEMMSTLVGDDGAVVMQSPPNFDGFLANAISQRLAGGRLANVRLSKTAFDQLEAEDGAVDLATWLLGPHELFFTPPTGGSLGDPAGAFAEIYRILKPGGAFVVLDHAAAPGTPSSSGGSVHRIDPAIVKQLAADAGFILSEESDILRNPKDDYEMSVFDPMVRRKTDRFLLKFVKPEEDAAEET